MHCERVLTLLWSPIEWLTFYQKLVNILLFSSGKKLIFYFLFSPILGCCHVVLCCSPLGPEGPTRTKLHRQCCKIGENKKNANSVFFHRKNEHVHQFWQKVSHSVGDYKNVKTRGQCMSLMKKKQLNFHFLNSLFSGIASYMMQLPLFSALSERSWQQRLKWPFLGNWHLGLWIEKRIRAEWKATGSNSQVRNTSFFFLK